MENIGVKVMCLITHENKALVSKGRDEAKGENFCRVLGGSLNFGEKAEDGIRREIREELNSEIENLKLLEVVENIFTYNDQPGHQIVFLFSADLIRKELYEENTIHIIEETYEFDAEWIPIDKIINKEVVLYPALDWTKFLK